MLFSGVQVHDGLVDVETATNVPAACESQPTMGSCVASYQRVVLSHPGGDPSLQIESCTLAAPAPSCSTPLPASCPELNPATLAHSCTTIVTLGQYSI
jgi:hypothetical protein